MLMATKGFAMEYNGPCVYCSYASVYSFLMQREKKWSFSFKTNLYFSLSSPIFDMCGWLAHLFCMGNNKRLQCKMAVQKSGFVCNQNGCEMARRPTTFCNMM